MGGYRNDGPGQLVVHLDAVIARLGRGSGLINSLLFAELDELKELFSGQSVTFELKSVPERVSLYEKLNFVVSGSSSQGLKPMKTAPKRFPVRAACAAAAASSSAAASQPTLPLAPAPAAAASSSAAASVSSVLPSALSSAAAA